MIIPPKELGVFGWTRLILTVATLLFLNGVMSWFSTPQEEDPRLSPRDGIVTVVYPGAIPRDLQRLIAKPVEDELAQVEAVREIKTRLRTDLMFMEIKLKDSVATEVETKDAWDKVQEGLDRAEKKFPETAGKPLLDRDIYDQDAVLFSISGGKDRLALLDEFRKLKDRLQSIPSVKKIDEIASPQEQLSVMIDRDKLVRYGVSLETLVKQLSGGNFAVPSGYIRIGDQRISVLTNSIYRSAAELSHFPVMLKSGDTIPLSQISSIARTPALPVSESMRYNGVSAMGLGVVAQKKVNMQQFGEDVRRVVQEYTSQPDFVATGIKVDEVSFQPKYVEERIHDIGMDLLKAVFLVGGVLMLMMGVRVGSIVAVQVPVVTAVTFGIFSLRGGILNQISIAAFILAIGLLVDNVVVIVDGIQDKLDRGLGPIEAGERTRKEYLVPLAAGTLTTVAAFAPILFSKGTTADFTRAIGTVASIALLSSYAFCILVTPLIASYLLKQGKARQWTFVDPLGQRMGLLVQRYPKVIVCCALAAVVTAMSGFRFVKKQFFPFADRDLVIVDAWLPEGTHYQYTEGTANRLEEEIRTDPRVKSVTTFVGRGVPPFYYNLPREPHASHIAQFIVKTHTKEQAKAFKRDREEALQGLVPFGTVMVKLIAQGPPIRAPIEVRIFSRDPQKLQKAAEALLPAVRQAQGVWKIRSTLGTGIMNYRFDVDDSAAGNFGVTRAEVSAVVLARTRGAPVTTFRGGEEPFSVNLMSKEGEDSKLADIESSYLGTTRTEEVYVKTVSYPAIEYSASVLEKRDRIPVVYIFGEVAPGSSENVATDHVREAVERVKVPEGVRVEMGGANAESAHANVAIFKALPAALFIMLMSLMFEFNSFRRVGIISLTVPLCAVGSIPGLILSHSIFGFITLLGFFTLAGTVIHNGIFLIDYIDHRIHDGVPMDEALMQGIQRRMRPILLTAVATIVELTPMILSKSTLWPPFAWAIITGLSVSTLMTLLVIPSVYKLVFEKSHPGGGTAHTGRSQPLVILLFAAGLLAAATTQPCRAETVSAATAPVTMREVLDRARRGPDPLAARSDAEKAEAASSARWRATFVPKLWGFGFYDRLDQSLGLINPLAGTPLAVSLPFLPGSLALERDALVGRAQVNQTLLDASQMFYGTSAARRQAEAARLNASRSVKDTQSKGLGYYLDILELRAKRTALAHYVENLRSRHSEIRRLYELGNVGEADLLKVKLNIDDAIHGIHDVEIKEELLGRLLGQTVGELRCLVPEDLPNELPQATAPAPADIQSYREDILALDRLSEASTLEAKAARSTLVPRLEVFAGYNYFKQDVLTTNHWGDIGASLVWPIFDGGVRYRVASAALAQRESLQKRKVSSELALEAQLRSALESLDVKRQEYEDRHKGVDDAQRVATLDFKRFKEGKVTMNTMLDSMDMLRDREEKAAVSKVHWYQEWFQYQSAAGVDISIP